MAEALEIERIENEDVLLLRLKGNITEDSHLDGLNQDPKKTVLMDLENVERINSYGIRQWINALKDLRKKIDGLIFLKVPPAMVEQFNMISNFGANGFVYSFYLPYYCEETDEEKRLLYELPEGKTPESAEGLAEQVAKREPEGKSYVFNDIEEEYFYFLQYQKGQSLEPDLVKQIQSFA